ncbi:MAG: efflux RND transporter permease subunit [Gammaproteobacteria bacterium]|nr:efflux RND transporter permease subunit [Gammaproteobacteria bacterium]
MHAILRFFAERHLLAYLISLAILLVGLGTLSHIKRDQFPDATLDEVVISTVYPGASPEDVELNVTNKIEKEIKRVTGIKQYSSYSREDSSLVWVEIDPDVEDKDKVKDEIRNAVSRVVDLPSEVKDFPLVNEIKSAEFPVLELGIASDALSYAELRDVARQLEKKLENVAGVSKVDRQAYRDREIRIELSPQALAKYELSSQNVVDAIQRRNIQSTGGILESPINQRTLVTLAKFKTPAELNDVVVQSTFDGPLVKIKDVANIKDDFSEEKILARINGENAISFVVAKKATADIIRTVDAIRGMVETEKHTLLKNVHVLYSNDGSDPVRSRLSIVLSNGIMGLVLIMIMLSLFLDFRTAFWVGLGIPIAVLGTIYMLPFFGAYLDIISLLAMVIVIGIVVDDAIIVSENIYRRYEEGDSAIDAVVNGTNEVFRPVLTAMLTTIIAFVPIFFLPGVLGKFAFVIPLVIILALSVSLIESMFALPAHLYPGLKNRGRHNAAPLRVRLFMKLKTAFAAWIYKALRLRYMMVVAFILALLAGVFYAKNNMEFILFPADTADTFVIDVALPNGTALETTSQKVKEFEALVKTVPELASFTTEIGAHTQNHVTTEGEHYASVKVRLVSYASRKRMAAEIIEDLKKQSAGFVGYDEIIYRAGRNGPPIGNAIDIKIIGADDVMRQKLAQDVVGYLKSIPGTRDVESDFKLGREQLEIKLNYANLARAELTADDVARAIRTAYEGQIATTVRYGDEDVDFRVVFTKTARSNLRQVLDISIANRTGRLIPLRNVAQLESSVGPANYNHYNGERIILISGDVDKATTTAVAVAAQVQQHINLEKYPGMRLLVGGEAEETAATQKQLLIIFFMAIMGIYFILMLLFNSATQPFIVLATIPFGMLGVIITFGLHNEPLSFIAMMGVIGMLGVVVNDALVLVDYFNEQRLKNPTMPLHELVASGTADRLRAIILTSVSTVAGLLPLAYGIGGADANMAPMALALGYGLVFATPLTLVLIPSMYLIGHDVRVQLANIFGSTRGHEDKP